MALSATSNTSLSTLPALPLDIRIDIQQRLRDLQNWRDAWCVEDSRLQQRLGSLDPNRRADVLLGSQIAGLRRQLALRVVRQPLLLDPACVQQVGLSTLRRHLTMQYACLSTSQRRLWLTNLFFC